MGNPGNDRLVSCSTAWALALGSALAAGCGEGAVTAGSPAGGPMRADVASLRRSFPAHAAAVTAGAPAPARTAAGFALAGEPGPSLRVVFPSRGDDPVRLETTRGFG